MGYKAVDLGIFKRRAQRQRGFTLVELMIVVAILGLLLAIAIPNFSSAQDRARLAGVKANMHSLQTVVEIYATNTVLYPENLQVAEIEARDTTLDNVDYWVEFSNPVTDLEGLGRSYDNMPGGGIAGMTKGIVYYEVAPDLLIYWIYGGGMLDGTAVKQTGSLTLVLTNGYTETQGPPTP